MNKILETDISKALSKDKTFRLIEGREQILKLIKEGYEFTDNELLFIAKYYSDIFIHYFTPDSHYIRIWLKAGHGINRNQFPLAIFKDQELLLEILNNYENRCNLQILKYATIETLKKYAENHSDFDFYRIFTLSLSYAVSRDQISTLLDDKYYKNKYTRGEKEYRKKGRSLCYGLEEPTKCICTSENEPENVLKIDCCKNVTLANEIILKDEQLPIKRKQDLLLWDNQRHKYLFFYISDLHLTHKIKEGVDKGLTLEDSIKKTIKCAVNNIIDDIENQISMHSLFIYTVLLIVGDVSYDYYVNERFYNLLREKYYGKIVVVLGNHELWNSDPMGTSKYSVDIVIEKYKLLFENLKIELLENELLVFSEHGNASYTSKEIFERETIIEKVIEKSEFCIFGATGFSGLNNQFNANNGIYRGAIDNVDLEKELSLYTSNTFDKVLKLTENKPLICLTHMPYTDWYSGTQNIDKCFFVNGHTHRNVYSVDGPMIYADNQIGYKNKSYKIKYFYFDTTFDIFENYSDGIHEIHFVDYCEFLRYKRYSVPGHYTFQNSKIYLLRKNGISMFISKSEKNKLAVLNGSKRNNLKYKDLEYYYDNLDIVGNIILKTSSEYRNFMLEISKEISELGGSGKIHGCIIDIDFFNKLYVNPYDGYITAYSAPILYCDKRIIYKSFYDLLRLKANSSEIISKMKKKYDSDPKFGKILVSYYARKDLIISSASSPDFSNAYKMSRNMKKLQAFFDDGIIKIWPDNLFDDQNVKKLK